MQAGLQRMEAHGNMKIATEQVQLAVATRKFQNLQASPFAVGRCVIVWVKIYKQHCTQVALQGFDAMSNVYGTVVGSASIIAGFAFTGVPDQHQQAGAVEVWLQIDLDLSHSTHTMR